MQDEVTSIKLRKSVVEKLKGHKKYRRETHEDVILRLIGFDANNEKRDIKSEIKESQKEIQEKV